MDLSPARKCFSITITKSTIGDQIMQGILRVGISKVDITPAIGTELCGHFRDDLKSTGIHSNLYAKALLLDDGEHKTVLVSCDLLGVASPLVASTRERITKLTGIPGRNVMISCTHTHSGPGSMPLRVIGKNDEAYQDQLEKKVAGAVYLASKNMKEASIGLGVGIEELATSRRVKWPDGTIRFDWLDPNVAPEEPIDKELNVLTVKDADGRIMGITVNFACHPVTMSGKASNLISSDFPGVATASIEKVKGDRTVGVFFNGAYADTHPRKDLVPGYNYNSPIKGDELTETLGTLLGAAALKISETTQTHSNVTIQMSSETIRGPLERLPSEEEIGDEIPKDRQMLEELTKAEAPGRDWWWLKQRLDWYDHLLQLYADGKGFEAYEDLEVQVVRIGDTYIVGLPGEVFSQIGSEIRARARKLGVNNVLIFALTNGNPGYVPAEADYTIAPIGKRGYELEGSYMLYGRPLVGPGTATLMIETALGLIRSVRRND